MHLQCSLPSFYKWTCRKVCAITETGLKERPHSGRSLNQRLYDLLFTYRISPHYTTAVSSCALFLKWKICLRFDILKPSQEIKVLQTQSQQKLNHDRHAQSRQFFLGQTVMVKNLRPGPAWIHAVVIEQLGSLSYLVKTEVYGLWRHHVDLLKEFIECEQPLSTLTIPPF